MSERGPVKVRQACVNEEVLVKNFSSGATWLKGIVVCVMTPYMCEVKLSDGRIVRRHVDHVRRVGICREYENSEVLESNRNDLNEVSDAKLKVVNSRCRELSVVPRVEDIEVVPGTTGLDSENLMDCKNSLVDNSDINQSKQVIEPSDQSLRRSQRCRQPPVKMKDFVFYK